MTYKTLRISLLSGLLVAALFDRAFGEQIGRPGGLTADAAGERALRRAPRARQNRAESDQADAGLRAAKLGWVPHVSATARYARLSSIDEPELGGGIVISTPLDQFSNHLSVELPVSDYLLKTPHEVEAATLRMRAAKESEAATRRAIEADARISFYEWARARNQVEVARQSVELVAETEATAANQVEAGTASQADLLRMQARHAQADLDLHRATHRAELAEERLRIAIGAGADEPLVLGEDLTVAAAPSAPADASTWERATQKRPELRALRAAEAAELADAKTARVGLWPRLTAFGELDYDNPNQRAFPPEDKYTFSWSAGAQLSWNLNAALGAGPAADAARARAAAHAADRDQRADDIRTDVVAASQAALEADESISVNERALAAAEEGFRVRRELYAAGRATSVEVIDAENELVRARTAAIDARIDQRVAAVKQRYASGE